MYKFLVKYKNCENKKVYFVLRKKLELILNYVCFLVLLNLVGYYCDI